MANPNSTVPARVPSSRNATPVIDTYYKTICPELRAVDCHRADPPDVFAMFRQFLMPMKTLCCIDANKPPISISATAPDQVGLVMTTSDQRGRRQWILSTDTYIFALANGMIPTDPLVLLLDPIAVTNYPDEVALIPHIAAKLDACGLRYRFVVTIDVIGNSKSDGEGIFWDSPNTRCAIVLTTVSDHTKATQCLASR